MSTCIIENTIIYHGTRGGREPSILGDFCCSTVTLVADSPCSYPLSSYTENTHVRTDYSDIYCTVRTVVQYILL